ncbi:transcriptional regulator, AraC family with amidase-like domain [Micromonospora echinaurantiaca]|uniref:Transcriptional regulator, AraC family with amidase-like domain n=1 Tax=Micromonospora echinaurantiaca TaxID=47857 RepID=A0A1C5JRW1_9ACTN|nr:DJ-1/PfpI family protein [Micromonospora echinaurantiaca]SCG73335.1 transcriptional regulator, AraC family with amidase-like domain [Micromonospora echinaurantiaca]
MRNNRAMTLRRHRIAVLALDHVVGLDLGTPAQVFGTARDADLTPLYTVEVCSPGARPVRSSGGYQVLPDHGLELLATADTVVVPGIHGGTPLTDGTLDAEVAEALRAAYHRGARVMSICTGAFVLAAAGLLDGRRATTHWGYAERFRRLHPAVDLDPDVLFIHDDQLLTSAGVAAGLDLCLHVIRTDHGSEVANRAARRCVVPPWRDGGQAQYIERPVPRAADASTAAAREWARQRLHEPVTLRDLAEQARMSVRTFTRRFRSETGLSPAQWLLQQRTDHARLLLETTDLTVDQVARRCGFGTAAALRQQLHLRIGVAPSAYRRAFRRQPEPA